MLFYLLYWIDVVDCLLLISVLFTGLFIYPPPRFIDARMSGCSDADHVVYTISDCLLMLRDLFIASPCLW